MLSKVEVDRTIAQFKKSCGPTVIIFPPAPLHIILLRTNVMHVIISTANCRALCR